MAPATIGVLASLSALAGVVCLLLAVRAHRAGNAAGVTAPGRPRGMRALGAMLRPSRDTELDELRSRTSRAGLYGRDALELFLTFRFVSLVGGAGAGLLVLALAERGLGGIVAALALGAAGLLLPGAWLDARAARRRLAISERLPDLLGLLVVSLEAGLALQQAVERLVATDDEGVSPLASGVLEAELRLVLADLRKGMPFEEALRRFAWRSGSEEVQLLSGVLGHGARMGSNIVTVLQQHAHSMRQRRLLELEEAAGKASAKLTLPLSLCLLPAGLILMIGPAMVALFDVL